MPGKYDELIIDGGTYRLKHLLSNRGQSGFAGFYELADSTGQQVLIKADSPGVCVLEGSTGFIKHWLPEEKLHVANFAKARKATLPKDRNRELIVTIQDSVQDSRKWDVLVYGRERDPKTLTSYESKHSEAITRTIFSMGESFKQDLAYALFISVALGDESVHVAQFLVKGESGLCRIDFGARERHQQARLNATTIETHQTSTFYLKSGQWGKDYFGYLVRNKRVWSYYLHQWSLFNTEWLEMQELFNAARSELAEAYTCLPPYQVEVAVKEVLEILFKKGSSKKLLLRKGRIQSFLTINSMASLQKKIEASQKAIDDLRVKVDMLEQADVLDDGLSIEAQAELPAEIRRLYLMKKSKSTMFVELLKSNRKMLADEQANVVHYKKIKAKTVGIGDGDGQKLAIKNFCLKEAIRLLTELQSRGLVQRFTRMVESAKAIIEYDVEAHLSHLYAASSENQVIREDWKSVCTTPITSEYLTRLICSIDFKAGEQRVDEYYMNLSCLLAHASANAFTQQMRAPSEEQRALCEQAHQQFLLVNIRVQLIKLLKNLQRNITPVNSSKVGEPSRVDDFLSTLSQALKQLTESDASDVSSIRSSELIGDLLRFTEEFSASRRSGGLFATAEAKDCKSAHRQLFTLLEEERSLLPSREIGQGHGGSSATC